jgi:hypothetical protein
MANGENQRRICRSAATTAGAAVAVVVVVALVARRCRVDAELPRGQPFADGGARKPPRD